MNESQARELWNNWNEDERLDFIVQHAYNPRFAKYAWAMLPYSVQSEIRMAPEPLSIPHVVGMCSACGNAYDLTKGIGCPECQSPALAWAYHATDDDEQADMIKRIREKLNPEPVLTEDDKRDIAELERLFKL